MSMDKNYYVIAGFDLTNYKTDKFDDWRWTDEGEKYLCYQRKGKIQLFDDPMNGDYLYLGYILAAGDEYEFKTEMFNVDLVKLVDMDVTKELVNLNNFGAIEEDALEKCAYKVIVFEEWT